MRKQAVAGRLPAIEIDPTALVVGAQQLGLQLDALAVDRLVSFGKLMVRWNAVHNLTAIRSSEEILTHHLLDSLALVPQLAQLTAGRAVRVLDVGAGGGLPGIPLAITWPQAQVTMVDAVQKKVAFITQAQLELRLANARAIHSRVESLHEAPFDVVTSRAFASLADFVGLTRASIASTGLWLAMKGVEPLEEIAALPDWVRVLKVIQLKVPGLDESRNLVVMQPVSEA
ncbi:MAG: 16S rRNA (guanine(527)-N(7))-methyltransferase RsmG [Burkholderiaceae bacterium]